MDNRVKAAFGQLHADDALKNNTKTYIYQKTDGYRRKKTSVRKRLTVVMACFFLAVFGWKGYFDYFTSVSTISIDVNPSFELDINRFDKVISVHAYNDGGASILSSANIRFLDYRKAMDVLLQSENMARYLTGEDPVEVTVFGVNEQKNNEMLENLNSCTASRGNVQCSVGNSTDAAKAHALGLSYGKYRAFLELQALDPSVTADDVRGLTMRQIRDMIRERSGDEDASDVPADENKNEDEPGNNSNGSGNGNGSGHRGNGHGNGHGGGWRHGHN